MNCPTRAKLFRERRTNRSKLLKNTEGQNFFIETWKLTALPRKRQTDVRYFKDFPVCMKRETKKEPPAKLDSIIYNFYIRETKEKTNMINRIHMFSIRLLFSKHPVLLGEQNEMKKCPVSSTSKNLFTGNQRQTYPKVLHS